MGETFGKKEKFLVDKEKLVQQFPTINLLKDEPLKYYTFTKTGGLRTFWLFLNQQKKRKIWSYIVVITTSLS